MPFRKRPHRDDDPNDQGGFLQSLGTVAPTPGSNVNSTDPIIRAAQIQADALTEGQALFQPFLEAGNEALPFLQQGSSVGGLDEILAQIFGSQSFQGLRDERERSIRGQLAAGGLTRSGAAVEEAANIPTELGFMIEQLLNNRSGGLVDRGQSSAFSIADLLSRSAEATASGILGLEERRETRKSDRKSDIFGLVSAGISAFSDPILKENIKPIRKIGPLTMVSWDWKPQTKGTIVEKCPTVGFLSTDVKEHFPELVSQYCGFDIIDYKSLVQELCP